MCEKTDAQTELICLGFMSGTDAMLQTTRTAYGHALVCVTEHLDEWLDGIQDTAKTKAMKRSTILKLAGAFPHAQEIDQKATQGAGIPWAQVDQQHGPVHRVEPDPLQEPVALEGCACPD
jgi:hypothetical protein